MTQSVSILVAFTAGLVSFVSPCVLPLIPAYLSFLSGVAVLDTHEVKKARLEIFLSALVFVLGFTIVFSLFGVGVGALGQLFIPYRSIMIRVGGVLIILFGLYMLGFFRLLGIPYLRPSDFSKLHVPGYIGAFLLGTAFAFAYVPCIGAILGSILVLASGSGTALSGGILLAVYSAGFGIPFLVVAVGVSFFIPILRRLNRFAGIIQVIAGVLMLLFGVLVASGLVTMLTARLGLLY